ncbi:DEAD, KH 1, Helicase C, and/or SNF2 N domain containing protein [Asbolus verrucosus]|uniref:RNA helicase n=1 Tax=Asbolus verrucosus TaxID=1661398 RepID=A0A482VW67_ASBVE|nr:DEAD, KH 1, Helicase C, and/or SNF2 N domain containing protein [Asbolus verrucosus]
MCDGWDDNPVIDRPQYPTQVFTNSNNDQGFSNWRDNSQRKYQKNGQREDRNGYRGGYRGPRRQNQDENATLIKVPSKFVGRIIGRGGCKINDLQFESGARINVTKETDGEQTVVKLIGDSDAMAKAESLIRDLTIEREPLMYVNHEPEPQEQKPPPEEPPREQVNWRAVFAKCDELEKAEWAKLPPIQKQFYSEHPEITAMAEEEADSFRLENNNIVVERTFKTDGSKPIPKPVLTFEHAFHQYPEILKEIEKAGFTQPSPIQSQAWPVLLSGEDLIGIAQTGTGKTLAFLLPALVHIDGQMTNRADRGGPAVLVMAPTRELALQIDKEVKKYEYRGITAVCVYGGGNRREQIKVVTEGVDIVIATPGRLNDLVEAGHLNVKYVTYVVLDEADRMLDMGFEPQIRKVMYSIRPTRQTVMTSATWPLGVRRLAQSYMVDPIQIYVGTLDLAATHTVTQIIQVMADDDDEKFRTFMDFAQNLDCTEKVIVFCGKKSRADEHVINYDFPRNIEEYVHRVGRTGRAGKSGKSISYITRGDWAQAKDLIAILEEAQQYVPEEVYQMAERHTAWKEKKEASRPSGGRRGGGRRWTNRHCRVKGQSKKVILFLEESKSTLIMIFASGLIFFLIFLGIIKGLIGLWCWRKFGEYGLNLLIDLPRPLPRYQEKHLEHHSVVYDIGGWPIHPTTLQRTVRVLPKRTEFCLNLIFFLACPIAGCAFLCSLCCCIRNYKSGGDDCFKHIDIIKLTSNTNGKNQNEPATLDVYNEDYKEKRDTAYVLDAMAKSKESIHEIRLCSNNK